MKKAILLLSGGLDSATCGLIARDMGFDTYALSFSYGQRHAFELSAAKKIASFLGVREYRVINIDLSFLDGSALTSDNVDIPKDGSDSAADGSIPVTYVPARNTIFLSYALARAEALGDCDDIFIGVNCVDYSGYPDCRPEYIAAFERMANLATVAGISGRGMTIHAPLMDLSKAEIIKIGVRAGFDYGMTYSCYDLDPKSGAACGCCDSCRIRRKGFADAGVADPTKYSG